MKKSGPAPSVSEDALRAVAQDFASTRGGLIPALHAIQGEHGYIPPPALGVLANVFNLSRADVHGVVTFYHEFKEAPPKKPVVKLCRAEACQARGVEALVARAERRADVAVETVYCLGLCASGPAAMVGDRVFARLDGVAFDRLLDEAAA